MAFCKSAAGRLSSIEPQASWRDAHHQLVLTWMQAALCNRDPFATRPVTPQLLFEGCRQRIRRYDDGPLCAIVILSASLSTHIVDRLYHRRDASLSQRGSQPRTPALGQHLRDSRANLADYTSNDRVLDCSLSRSDSATWLSWCSPHLVRARSAAVTTPTRSVHGKPLFGTICKPFGDA